MQKKIAVLIDAENIKSSYIPNILTKLGSYGEITVKRIYADWTQQRNNRWKEYVNSYAIKTIQKFSYTVGKGSSDTALIIDAMDLLHTNKVDIFCIVSSDSDYTGLAHRIREDDLTIIGIGESYTPSAFVASCNHFIYLDDGVCKKVSSNKLSSQQVKKIDYDIINKAFNITKSDGGTILQSRFKESLSKIDNNFNVKDYGFKKFHDFCKSLNGYELIRHNDRSTYSIKKL